MTFALLMGSARAFYGKYGDKINLAKFMLGSGVLCVLSYLCISLSPSPALSVAGCAVCGLSVGITIFPLLLILGIVLAGKFDPAGGLGRGTIDRQCHSFRERS